MNSGLHDAFNLAWKLALVCQGHSTPALLDSYEAERRPVAEAIAASGDAFEDIQDVTDPAERRARDAKLRDVFTDSASRHHEAVAEAELDIDYERSPIVIGSEHELLSPGQRLPDSIEVERASGEALMLHELTNRAGHTALLIGGSSADGDELARLESAIRSPSAASVIEATFVLTSWSDNQTNQTTFARLRPAAADPLRIEGITLLVVRPDGHVGLRADREHLEALASYHALMVSAGT